MENDNDYIEEEIGEKEEIKEVPEATPEQLAVFNNELMPQIDALYN